MAKLPDFTLPYSLWASTAAPAPNFHRLEGQSEVDLAVIGGGFSGLSTAYHARRRGLSVAILEAAEIGWGASGRNNGQVIPTLSKRDPADIIAKFGMERGERIISLVRDSADLVFDLIRELKIRCDAEQTGWIQPAHTPGRVDVARRRHDAWAKYGADVAFYDRQEITELIGSQAYYGGWGNLSGGHINPLSLARGLAAALEKMGVLVFVRTPARGIEHNWDRWEITTPSGRVVAARVVMATNAYSDDLFPGLNRSMVPVNSWQLATMPLNENVRATIVPGRQAVSDTRGELGFFRFDAQNRLVTGGATMWPFGAEAKLRTSVAARLASWFPQIGRPRFEYAWSGKLAMTTDFFPHVHQLGEGAYTWIGCNGRGVALSFAMGRELANLVAGDEPGASAVPITKLAPIRAHAIVKRLGPPVTLWKYRRADRRDRPA